MRQENACIQTWAISYAMAICNVCVCDHLPCCMLFSYDITHYHCALCLTNYVCITGAIAQRCCWLVFFSCFFFHIKIGISINFYIFVRISSLILQCFLSWHIFFFSVINYLSNVYKYTHSRVHLHIKHFQQMYKRIFVPTIAQFIFSLSFDLVYDAFVCKAKLIWFALLRFSLFYFKICVMRVHHRSAFIGKSGSLCFNIDKSYLINCKLLDATLFFSVECCLFAHYQSRTNLFVVILKFICFEICMRVKRVCVICLSVRL